MHFQTILDVSTVLDAVLDEELEKVKRLIPNKSSDQHVWILTGTGHHRAGHQTEGLD